MAKPYKLRDGNGPGGSLRDAGGKYSYPTKPNPRPTEVYPGQMAMPIPARPSLQRDVMPARSPQDPFGPAVPTPKPSRLK